MTEPTTPRPAEPGRQPQRSPGRPPSSRRRPRSRACLGLVREMVSAYFFGVSGLINAFTVAIQIPNLVRALVADAALSGAFVPVFSELLEKGEKQRAWRVASTLFWLTLLVLGAVTAVFILLAPLLMRPFGDPGGDYDLAVGLSRVLFPIVVLLGLSGIVVGILNTYHHFALPALAPVAWNLVIIVGPRPRHPADRRRERAALPLRRRRRRRARSCSSCCRSRGCGKLDGRLTMVIDWRDPGRQPRARAHAAGDADDRARQRELPRGHALRVAAPRSRARAGGDRQGVPAVHAPAGRLRRRGDDGALPDARAARGAGRHRRAPPGARRRPPPDRVPARSRPASSRSCSPSRSSSSCTSAASSPPRTP